MRALRVFCLPVILALAMTLASSPVILAQGPGEFPPEVSAALQAPALQALAQEPSP